MISDGLSALGRTDDEEGAGFLVTRYGYTFGRALRIKPLRIFCLCRTNKMMPNSRRCMNSGCAGYVRASTGDGCVPASLLVVGGGLGFKMLNDVWLFQGGECARRRLTPLITAERLTNTQIQDNPFHVQ